jgi:DNA polymerase-3 subunit alpha
VISDGDDILKKEVIQGYKKRNLPSNDKRYIKRIEEEYSLITRKGFTSYFLIQKMMTDEARRVCRDLLGFGDGSQAVGPGRGSACGSLICYCLGITNVDPIREELLFSRFMSEARGGRTLQLDFKNIDPVAPEDIF